MKCLRLTCDLYCSEIDDLDVNKMIVLLANLNDCHDIAACGYHMGLNFTRSCEGDGKKDEGSGDSKKTCLSTELVETKFKGTKSGPFIVGDLEVLKLGKMGKDLNCVNDEGSIGPLGYKGYKEVSFISSHLFRLLDVKLLHTEYANNMFLQCDKCRMMVHARCYGELEPVDGVLWLCNLCRPGAPEVSSPCCLCPVTGGAMKLTTDGRWAHLARGVMKPISTYLLVIAIGISTHCLLAYAGTVVGLEKDTDRYGFLLVRVQGIHNPLRVNTTTIERVTSGLATGNWVHLIDYNRNHSSIGIPQSIDRDGSVTVGFIGQETLWKEHCSQHQIADPFSFLGKFARKGDCKLFLADPSEAEHISFDTCHTLVDKYEHVEDHHWVVRPLMVAFAVHTAMKFGFIVGHNMGSRLKKGYGSRTHCGDNGRGSQDGKNSQVIRMGKM
ncbi:E3 ubiquitin protein ligase KEG-like protein [Tanacetum coccineum]